MKPLGELVRPLTAEEKRAIESLRRLAHRWPKSLWIFAASGTCCVMQCDENGERAHASNFSVDSRYTVETIRELPIDGGDW